MLLACSQQRAACFGPSILRNGWVYLKKKVGDLQIWNETFSPESIPFVSIELGMNLADKGLFGIILGDETVSSEKVCL